MDEAAPFQPGGEITPDARSLRGLAHPLRIRLLGLLRSEGPSTATRLANRLGLTSGATSFHLRQLAAHGFIVERPEAGTGRERWWAAAHQSTKIPHAADPETAEAADGFLRGAVAFWSEQLHRAIDERPALATQWRDASLFSDTGLRLTLDELSALRRELWEVITRYRADDAAGLTDAPADSVRVIIQLQAFPRPGATPSPGTMSTEDEA